MRLSMADPDAQRIAADLIARDGLFLDRCEWDEWLALYTEDCVFWVPAWRNESETVTDPDTEVSLIYHDSRVGLEERVHRVRTGKSVTTMPMPRTAHFVSNLLVTSASAGRIEALSSWQVAIYQPRSATQSTLAERYEHVLTGTPSGWKIASKKVILINDRVPTLVDFYCL